LTWKALHLDSQSKIALITTQPHSNSAKNDPRQTLDLVEGFGLAQVATGIFISGPYVLVVADRRLDNSVLHFGVGDGQKLRQELKIAC
jgi:hypothetical protein